MTDDLAAPYRRLAIPGVAEVIEGHEGLPKVRITTADAAAEMYLHGAHVTSWKPAGAGEALFLSAQSRWQHGRAIRGGVPICFPWFGGKADDPAAPAHGLVRTKAWRLESISQVGRAVSVSMYTESDADTEKWWPGRFRLVHRVTFGRELSLELTVSNSGGTAFRFEEALHTYHRVADVAEVRLHGLDGAWYVDKTDSNRMKTQRGEVVIASETDRVYLDTMAAVELDDPGMHRRTRVTKQNSRTTVVWNPWIGKARALGDMGDEEWPRMVCIETSNVGQYAVALPPGREHTMRVNIGIADS
jgi:glucose-6-phosphate 1-epimerase